MNRTLVEFIRKKKSSNKVYGNRSLCCLSTTNKFRAFFMNISSAGLFNAFIIITILLNSIVLALEEPPKPGMKKEEHLQETMEIAFLVIYTGEMFIKIIAMGFLLEPDTYLRDPWNILDFLVVVSSWGSH
jgi:hypothetical protein